MTEFERHLRLNEMMTNGLLDFGATANGVVAGSKISTYYGEDDNGNEIRIKRYSLDGKNWWWGYEEYYDMTILEWKFK